MVPYDLKGLICKVCTINNLKYKSSLIIKSYTEYYHNLHIISKNKFNDNATTNFALGEQMLGILSIIMVKKKDTNNYGLWSYCCMVYKKLILITTSVYCHYLCSSP